MTIISIIIKDSANREQSGKLACMLCRGAAYLIQRADAVCVMGSDNMMPYNIIDLIESDETLATCQMFNAEVPCRSNTNRPRALPFVRQRLPRSTRQAWRAITELNAKAKEAEGIRRQTS